MDELEKSKEMHIKCLTKDKKSYTFDEVREIVLDIIGDKIARAGLDRTNLSNETDLMLSGILDSFAFLDTIGLVEDHIGLTVDLAQIDTNSFTTLEGFVNEILR